MSEKPKFFATPAAFRAWLAKHHDRSDAQWVGFYRRGSGKPSITWPESVDEALSFGWIDGVRKSIDDEAYMIRFTPRKPSSIWSAVNTKRMRELIAENRVHPAGLAAFEKRDERKTQIYAYERGNCELPPELEKTFRANRKAWEFHQAQPPGYRRQMCWYVMSAKRDETRRKRLETLIQLAATGKRLR